MLVRVFIYIHLYVWESVVFYSSVTLYSDLQLLQKWWRGRWQRFGKQTKASNKCCKKISCPENPSY